MSKLKRLKANVLLKLQQNAIKRRAFNCFKANVLSKRTIQILCFSIKTIKITNFKDISSHLKHLDSNNLKTVKLIYCIHLNQRNLLKKFFNIWKELKYFDLMVKNKES